MVGNLRNLRNQTKILALTIIVVFLILFVFLSYLFAGFSDSPVIEALWLTINEISLLISSILLPILVSILLIFIKKKEHLKKYKLGWSKEWHKRNVRKNLLASLKLESLDNLMVFIENSELWESFITTLFNYFGKTNGKWIEKAFGQIKICAK